MTAPLDAATRDTELAPLLAADWTMVQDRDAIHKTFKFANFIECLPHC
jgi:4a-hydroxytetrahydrobiopterin dehydratase